MRIIGHVKLPRRARPGLDVLPWATEVNQCLQQLRDRAVNAKTGKKINSRTETPFKVSLITTGGETPTYEVTVGWGYVCERVPGPSDAIAYHEPANMWDTEDPSILRKFPITVGQAVYIRTEVDEDGLIGISEGDAVTIVVDDDEESSTHYIPKVDDGNPSGTAGHYLYKLAVLKAPVSPSTTPTIEKWLTGSHIDHYQELPAMLSATAAGTGIGVIPKEWSDSEKAYKFRAIQAGDGITVEQEVDAIKISSAASHPWKASGLGTAFIAVAPGKMFFPSPKGADPADVTPIVYDYISYAGGSVEVTSATGWIYAVGTVSGVVTVGGQDSLGITTTGISIDSVILEVRVLSELSVVFSADDPSLFDPADGNIYWPIAQVALAASVATVTDQILTHNPTDSLHKINFS